MGKRIKDLTTTSSPANDDYLPVDSANSGTRKISASLITGKQDAIIAGTNITIAADGKTISATDTTYSAGTNVQINNGVISATDTTYSAFTGATSGADGSSGLVPQPLIADKDKFLKGDGSWDTIQPGASALDDLTNVDITSPTNGQVLKYDSTNQEWVNANESGGGGGSTVTITPTLSTGTKIADYSIDGSTGALFAPSGSGGASALSDLTDVTLTSPTDGQALVYDATNQEWVNGTVSGGGGSGLTATILSNTLWSSAGTYTLNDDYDNYDILEIYFCNPSVAGQESDLITVMVNDVKALMNDSKILNLTGYGDRYVNCTFSADEFTITASSTGGVQKIVGYKAGGGSGDITTLDFSDMTNTQISDMMDNLNGGIGSSDSGTFTTGGTQYEKVEVNCGFRPTYIEVTLPFQSGDTTAIYDASISTTTSTWTIPQEHNTYTIVLGSETGETGITDITDTGFKFRCNAPNTRNVQCTYSANVVSETYIQTVDFDDISSTQADDILGKLDFTSLSAQQIADLKIALGIS